MTGQHRQPTDRKGLRRFLTVPIVLVMVVALAGIAFALWLAFFQVDVDVTTAGFTVNAGGAAQTAVASAGTCTIDTEEPNVGVTMSGMIGGDTCTLTLAYNADAGNSGDAKYQGFTLVDDGTWTAGTEISTDATASCGTSLAPGVAGTVEVVITVGAESAPGATYSFGTGSGNTWVPAALYDAGTCQ